LTGAGASGASLSAAAEAALRGLQAQEREARGQEEVQALTKAQRQQGNADKGWSVAEGEADEEGEVEEEEEDFYCQVRDSTWGLSAKCSPFGSD
jgi:hypothetical protein